MEKFELKESVKIPRILIDYKKGEIKITGRSTLNNPSEFYPRLIDLFQLYAINPQPTTRVLIDLEYYTNESAQYIFSIIKLLIGLEKNKTSIINITWHYDPDDFHIISDINMLSSELNYKINAYAYEMI